MNVLSLFDGIACGKVALDRVGIKYENYFSSEINEKSCKVASYNHNDLIHIGDVTKIDPISLPPIDLLIGGSPCQSFSMAGDRSGFSGKSGLFYEYVKLLNQLNPKYFLLENVVMKSEWRDVISNELGVKPILFNSSLVSAQDRPRLYWTNIPFTLPIDKGITLKDIVSDRSSLPIDLLECEKQVKRFTSRDFVIKVQSNGNIRPHRTDPKSSGISEIGTICHTDNKSTCLIATHIPKIHYDNPIKIRKLTISECERLQTLPIGYTDVPGISMNQRQAMLGNGWTVDVVAHIFKGMSL